jgi:hypothetical protein
VIDPTSLGAARVLARFDRGAPAVLEVTVGQGRLYVLTAGWTPADSQLALSSKFVPLLWSLLEIAGARADAPAQLSVRRHVATDEGAWRWRCSAGQRLRRGPSPSMPRCSGRSWNRGS